MSNSWAGYLTPNLQVAFTALRQDFEVSRIRLTAQADAYKALRQRYNDLKEELARRGVAADE